MDRFWCEFAYWMFASEREIEKRIATADPRTRSCAKTVANGLSCLKWFFLNLCINVVVIAILREHTNWNEFIDTLSAISTFMTFDHRVCVVSFIFSPVYFNAYACHLPTPIVVQPTEQGKKLTKPIGKKRVFMRGRFSFVFAWCPCNDAVVTTAPIELFWIIVGIKILFDLNVMHINLFVFHWINHAPSHAYWPRK